MARKRMIDPGFWTDEKLGTLTPLHRILFMGLISNADDEGRLQGHPALIKSTIFPYDIDITVSDVQLWLNDLCNKKLIQIYSVDEQVYIFIKNFLKYQQINRPTPSRLPEPPKEDDTHGALIDNSLNAHGELTPNRKEKNRKENKENRKEIHAADAADECDITPAEKSSDDEGAQPLTVGKGNIYTNEFEEFWEHYPRKLEKKTAFKAWNARIKRDRAAPESMIQAAINYAKYCELQHIEQRYVKHASTFLGPDKPFEEFINGIPEQDDKKSNDAAKQPETSYPYQYINTG
jgi:hypothetical protein